MYRIVFIVAKRVIFNPHWQHLYSFIKENLTEQVVFKYLSEKPEINNEMTLMVRHLPQTAEGIPIQIYAFTFTKKWEDFEEIQARMLEYMLARAKEFGIRPYQRRSDKH